MQLNSLDDMEDHQDNLMTWMGTYDEEMFGICIMHRRRNLMNFGGGGVMKELYTIYLRTDLCPRNLQFWS